MSKRINKSLYILNDKKEKIVVELDNNGMIVGDYKIKGNASKIWGNASNIWGDVSGLRDDVSSIIGDATGLRGDVYSIAEYLKKNKLNHLKNAIDVSLLID